VSILSQECLHWTYDSYVLLETFSKHQDEISLSVKRARDNTVNQAHQNVNWAPDLVSRALEIMSQALDLKYVKQ